MAEGLAARQAALALLMGVLGDRLPLSDLAEGSVLAKLPASDRARALRLATETLRQIEPIDRLLQTFLKREPALDALNILRLAVTELQGGAAAHGVVNSAVELSRRSKATSGAAGMINAVLRKVPSGVTLVGPEQKMPRWLRQPMVHAYGRDAVAAIEAVQATAPPLDLTLNGALRPEGLALPTGSLRVKDAGQVSTLAGYAEGSWWVQDAAAALAVPMLGDVSGLRVLDLCAAPGGKTMQLAARGAQVTALDISGPRMARVRENLTRTGLLAELVVADALHWQPEVLFDAVLLDAPCSATGTIRRHPDLQYIKDGSEIAALVPLQAALFDRALGMVRPGGRLVYCTCSLLVEEGEWQLSAALARHPDLRVVRTLIPGVPEAWFGAEGGLRLRPDYWADLGGMDGFFMVCVTK
ncbi:MAG: transcription antitermination factor NusB [bacterium]